MLARLGRVVGFSFIHAEKWYHGSAEVLAPRPGHRIHHKPKNTKCDSMNDVAWVDWSNCWALSFGTKKKLFGSHRIDNGGFCHQLNQDQVAKRRNNADHEPVFDHSPDQPAFEDLINDVDGKVVIDFSLGDGSFCHAAVKAKIPFLGVCLSATHLDLLHARLEAQLMQPQLEGKMIGYYDANLAIALAQVQGVVRKKSSSTLEVGEDISKKAKAEKGKGKANSVKGVGKKAAKTKAKKSAGDDVDDGDEASTLRELPKEMQVDAIATDDKQEQEEDEEEVEEEEEEEEAEEE